MLEVGARLPQHWPGQDGVVTSTMSQQVQAAPTKVRELTDDDGIIPASLHNRPGRYVTQGFSPTEQLKPLVLGRNSGDVGSGSHSQGQAGAVGESSKRLSHRPPRRSGQLLTCAGWRP